MKQRGFTMIELLIVIAILGILSTVSLGMFTGSIVKGKDAKRKSDLATLVRGLEAYKGDFGVYPSDDGSGKVFGCQNSAAGAVVACPTTGNQFRIFKGNDANKELLYLPFYPTDSDTTNRQYYYVYDTASDTYSLYAALENTEDKDVKRDASGVVVPTGWGISCGKTSNIPCNYKVTNYGLEK